MEIWKKCEGGCGKCILNVKSKQFVYIDPFNILEWAHNVIDIIEEYGITMGGIPLKYFITCTYGAIVSDIISLPGPVRYTDCTTYKRDLLRDIISTLSYTMIMYTTSRIVVSRNMEHISMVLSPTSILSFKTHTLRQQKFTAIHSMIDNISVVESSKVHIF
jgi:hypothetical protein